MRMLEDKYSAMVRDGHMTRQRAYQLRCVDSGRCMACGKPAVPEKSFCMPCLISRREKARIKKGVKRRNTRAWSYQEERRMREAIKSAMSQIAAPYVEQNFVGSQQGMSAEAVSTVSLA